MPIKEALFWVGITVLGTGLFFVVEGGDRMPLAVSLTIFGVAVVAYSVYAHHKPDARYRVPIWVSLLIVTWLAIGYDYYDRHAAMAIPAGEHAIPVPKVKTIEQWPSERLEMVLNQTFANQEVRLDGRNYIKCTFKNVTFVYDGTAPTALASQVGMAVWWWCEQIIRLLCSGARSCVQRDSSNKTQTSTILFPRLHRNEKGKTELAMGYFEKLDMITAGN